MHTRRYFLGALAASSFPGAATSAAQWPDRPVRMIYPYAAGSSTDGVARLFAQRFSEVFGQAFVVENRPGANGVLAVASVARAPADGHTLLWAVPPPITMSPTMTKVPYDPLKDLTPVSAATRQTFALIANAQMPVRTVSEFVEYVRRRPNQLAYAEAGIGSTNHLSMALFLNRAGLQMSNVSYRGSALALTDVIAGHVPAMFTLLGDVLPHTASGAIRMLAVSSEERSQRAPDIPTIGESGFPGFKVAPWSGLMAPAETPSDIVHRLAAEVARAMRDAKSIQQLDRFGVEPLNTGPEEFAAIIAADLLLWAEAVKIAGVKMQ